MSIFDCLKLIGGLSMFLFGMSVMGTALERRAGTRLKNTLKSLTSSKLNAFLTGIAITAIIQSSSATTVLAVGFVNSGLIALRQAINLIMGANIGTTVTAWVLSLSGISGDSLFMRLLKPSVFSTVFAFIGIIYYIFLKDKKKKDSGLILLGFAILMFGMDEMSKSVAGLAELEGFKRLLLLFESPILGVLAGALLTAIIQSSSASVGILQALSSTGALSIGISIPIIMGQNIGTCATAMLSAIGANKNAKRAASVHLLFNLIGTAVCLVLFYIARYAFNFEIFSARANAFEIAIIHTIFNVFCTVLLLPMSELLEKIVVKLVPDTHKKTVVSELDERLFASPAIALERANSMANELAEAAMQAINLSFAQLEKFDQKSANKIRELEEKTDHIEDILDSFLVNLSSNQISAEDSEEVAKLLRMTSDFERIGDYAINILVSAEELDQKNIHFSSEAVFELRRMIAANEEILELTHKAFEENSLSYALSIEPLEQIIDILKESMRKNHIRRLQKGDCTVENGIIWSELITSLERCADHCSNVAGYIIDLAHHTMNLHASLKDMRQNSPSFKAMFKSYSDKYLSGINVC